MEGGKQFATVRDWNEEYFAKNGCFEFLGEAALQGKEAPIEVAYTGMGFMLVKRGVLEKLDYPWFKPVGKRIGDMVDFTMEDVGFCLRAKEQGLQVLIDPLVRVGHEKRVVL
jgi:hypothetical protein